eukprot:NODE_15_length_42055_cov_0.634117.p5 type:complete len:672 gc:universal NODE_15_length_42055_cov_0.634117:26405-24390(-)
MVSTSDTVRGEIQILKKKVAYSAIKALFFNDQIVYISPDNEGSSATAYVVSREDGKLDSRPLISAQNIQIVRHPEKINILYIHGFDRVSKYTDSLEKTSVKNIPVPKSSDGKVRGIVEFLVHPFEDNWFIVKSCLPGEFVSMDCIYYYSVNDGDEWKTLNNPKKCIWAHSRNLLTTPRTAVLCQTSDSAMIASDDFFQSSISVFDRDSIKVFSMYGSFIVGGLIDNTKGLVVDISIDGISFSRAQFSPPYESADSITATDSAGGRLFIDVKQSDNLGNLYVSNYNGTYFTKTLDNTYRNHNGVDTSSLEGIRAIHFANVNVGNSLHTKISYDNGNTWFPLTMLVDNNILDLNLYGYTSAKDSRHFFDSKNSPGIIVGVGNTGAGIDPAGGQANTYYSVDAGLSWHKIFDAPYDFEFLNYGSVIVLFQSGVPVEKIYYTVDEFKNIEELSLSGTYTLSIGTADENSEKAMLFLGGDDQQGGHQAIVVDFKAFLGDNCSSDQTSPTLITVPTSGSHSNCIFGAEMTVHRKNTNDICYMTKLQVDQKPCGCSRLDYECDYGFQLQNGKCVATDLVLEFPCVNGQRVRSSGYRLNPGNACRGGIDMSSPIIESCGSMGVGAILAIILIPTAIGIAGFFLMLYLRRHGELPFGLSDRFRQVRYTDLQGEDNRLFDD